MLRIGNLAHRDSSARLHIDSCRRSLKAKPKVGLHQCFLTFRRRTARRLGIVIGVPDSINVADALVPDVVLEPLLFVKYSVGISSRSKKRSKHQEQNESWSALLRKALRKTIVPDQDYNHNHEERFSYIHT